MVFFEFTTIKGKKIILNADKITTCTFEDAYGDEGILFTINPGSEEEWWWLSKTQAEIMKKNLFASGK